MNFFFVIPFFVFVAFCICFFCARRRNRTHGRRVDQNVSQGETGEVLLHPPFVEPAYNYYPVTREGAPGQQWSGIPPLVVGAPIRVTTENEGRRPHSEGGSTNPVPMNIYPQSNVFLEYVPSQPLPSRFSTSSSPSSLVSPTRLGQASRNGAWMQLSTEAGGLPPVQYPIPSSGSGNAFSEEAVNSKKDTNPGVDPSGLVNAQFLPEPDEEDRRAVYGDGASYLPSGESKTQRSSSTDVKKSKRTKK